MYVFFSGEGSSDLGECRKNASQPYCCGGDYLPGPMAWIVSAIIEEKFHYSILESDAAVFIDGAELERIKDQLKPPKKSIRLRSNAVPAETRFHFEDARSFAFAVCNFVSVKHENEFLAILFRDSNTNDQQEWSKKRDSMISGFEYGFAQNQIPNNGIPMLPQPVSEAWLLCAIYRQKTPNKDCGYLEKVKRGNGKAHQLKIELEKEIGQPVTRELLNDYVKTGRITPVNINLSSFTDFQKRLIDKI